MHVDMAANKISRAVPGTGVEPSVNDRIRITEANDVIV